MATLTHGMSAADIRALADNDDSLDRALDESAASQGLDALPPVPSAEPEPATPFSIDTDLALFRSLMSDDDEGADAANPAVESGVSTSVRDTGPATLYDDVEDDDEDDVEREPFMPPPPAVAPDGDSGARATEEGQPTLEPVEPAGESRSGGATSKILAAGASAKNTVRGLPANVKLLGAVAAVVLLIFGVIFAFAGRGDEPETPAPPAARAPADTTGADVTDPAVTGGALLQASTVSSSCPEGATATTLAFSTDERDAWVCPRAHGLDGTVLNITFRDPVSIESIRFTPGFNFVDGGGTDMWNRYRVITKVRWKAGGQQWVQDIVPSRGETEIVLDQPISTQALSMTILQSVEASETVGGGTAGGAADPFGGDVPSRSGTVDATAVQNVQVYGRVL